MKKILLPAFLFLIGCESKQQREALIHYASANGDVVTVDRLLEKDDSLANHADPHTARTPLFDASTAEVVQSLIEEGANINARDNRGDTPLHAAKNGEVAMCLLENGANIQFKNNNGRTPIFTAANGGVVAALVKRGADIQSSYNTAWPYNTPLYQAVIDGRAETVKALIDLGADANVKDRDNGTLLHHAADKGNKDAVECLLLKGLTVDAVDKFGATPLHHAVLNDHIDVAEALLEKGANANAKLAQNVAVVNYAEAANRVGPPPPGRNWGESSAGNMSPLKLAKSEAMRQLLLKYYALE